MLEVSIIIAILLVFFFRTWEMILCSSCGQFGTHVGCTKWASNPPFLLCPACLPAHENSQPTTRSAEAVKFNQGGAVKKSSTGAAGATKFNQVGTVAKSVTNIRKGMCFLRHFVFCYVC